MPRGDLTVTSSEFQWGAWEDASNAYLQCTQPYNTAAVFMWLLTWAFFGYAGWRRIQMRRRFGLPGDDVRDYTAWLLCPACALCQETRTLAHNRVDNGMWHGPLARAPCVGTVAMPPPMQAFPGAYPAAAPAPFPGAPPAAYPQQHAPPAWSSGAPADAYSAHTAALFPMRPPTQQPQQPHGLVVPPPPPVPPPAVAPHNGASDGYYMPPTGGEHEV